MWKLKSKVVPEISIIYCDKLNSFYLTCLLPLSLTYLPSVHPSVLFLPSSSHRCSSLRRAAQTLFSPTPPPALLGGYDTFPSQLRNRILFFQILPILLLYNKIKCQWQPLKTQLFLGKLMLRSPCLHPKWSESVINLRSFSSISEQCCLPQIVFSGISLHWKEESDFNTIKHDGDSNEI